MDVLTGFLLLAAAFPLDSIQVEGLKRLRPEQVVAASGLKTGQKVDKPDFEAAQTRLLDTGMMASVGYRYASSPKGGYALTFEVAEVDQVFPVQFEEIPAAEAQLLEALAKEDPLFTNPVPGTETVIRRLEGILNRRFPSKPPIVGRILADNPDEPVLLFRPNSPRPTVASVKFTGNQAFTAAELQNRIAAVAIGTLFTEERFRELLMNQIRPLYETKGLLRASFPGISASPSEGTEGLDVEVAVVEGPEYTLSKVLLSGAPGATELLKLAAFKEGEVFRIHEITGGLERLRAALRSQGFMKVTTEASRTYDDGRKSVEMTVLVKPGTRYKMGKLTIQGLDITTEPEIRKLWALEEGDWFREGYPERVLARVRSDGLLDNLGETKAKLQVDEDAGRVDVTLEFAAAPKPEPKRKF